MKVRIEVTQEHIDKALRTKFATSVTGPGKDRTKFCPIACAIRATVGDSPEVNDSSAQYKKGKHYFCGELPRAAQRFIQRFDWEKPVKPLGFSMNFEEVAD